MIKLIDVKIKLVSVNNKYNFSRGKFVLKKEYRELKETLSLLCRKETLPPPYRVMINIETYLDIDNPLKLIIDCLSKSLGDDKLIYELIVKKTPIKRGHEGRLQVFAETITC